MVGQTDQNGRTKKKQGRSKVDVTYFNHVNVVSLVRLMKQNKSRIFFINFELVLAEIKMILSNIVEFLTVSSECLLS